MLLKVVLLKKVLKKVNYSKKFFQLWGLFWALFYLFLASPDAQEVIVVSQWVSESELADLTDVTLVSDDTFRRLGKWVTHDHLSSVIESNLTDVTLVSDDT